MRNFVKRFKVAISILTAVSMLAVPIALVGCAGGCASVGKTTYQTSGFTHISATTALAGWNKYLGVKDAELIELAKTKPAEALKERNEIAAQVVKVKDAYAKYQSAQLTLLTAGAAFSTVPTNSPGAPISQAQLDAAIAAVSVTLGELVGLVQQFGVKL